MRTIKLLALLGAFVGVGCTDSGVPWSLPEGASNFSPAGPGGPSGGLTVGDVVGAHPTPGNSANSGDDGHPVPLSGTMQARVRNTTARSAEVTIRFLLNDLAVHLARLRIGPRTTTAITGPDLAQLVEFTGVDETGATLPPAVFVFEAGADNLVIYVIVGGVEPPPGNENDNGGNANVNANENFNANGNLNENGNANVNANLNANANANLNGNDNGGGGGPPFADCNGNGVADLYDIAAGTSGDCNLNLVPDECDIAAGISHDADSNGVPDECEDCNENGTADALDLELGQSADCNGNHVPDECDIAAGTSTDCQPNGIPDECDIATRGRAASARDAADLLFPLDGTYTLAMPPNDDGSSSEISLGFEFDFYGGLQGSTYINNNGNLSFGGAFSTYTAAGFPVEGFPMVAPFWADVDTRNGYGNVWFKIESDTLIVTWEEVGYYNVHGDKLNTFQVAVSDGLNAIMGFGNNVCFSYGDMQWTTGDASGGSGGFGGTPATVGANQGNGVDYFLIGRFDHEGTDYDGPGGAADGVSFLDGQTICFNTATTTTNVDPIATGFPSGNTLAVNPTSGEMLDLELRFLSPEPGQTTTVTIDDLNGAAAAGLSIVNTPGNVATVQLHWTPACADFGSYVLEFTATDDFNPPGQTTVSLTIVVACSGGSSDCNTNGIPDECDIAAGTSADANSNGVPDECEFSPPVLYAVEAWSDALYTLDPETGFLTLVANMEPDVDGAHGLSFDTVRDGALFVIADVASIGLALVRVDPDTAAASFVGWLTEPVVDIGFDSEGVLYGVTGGDIDYPGEIVMIDLSDASISHLDLFGAGGDAQSIVFLPGTSLLYHTACPDNCVLETIDVTTGVVTVINATLTAGWYEGLTYDASAARLLGASWMDQVSGLYAIDPATGAETLLNPLSTYTPVSGLSFRPGGAP
jgi:hypothetical protein